MASENGTHNDEMEASRWKAQREARLAALSAGGRKALGLLREAREVWSLHQQTDGGVGFGRAPSPEALATLALLISSERNAGEGSDT